MPIDMRSLFWQSSSYWAAGQACHDGSGSASSFPSSAPTAWPRRAHSNGTFAHPRTSHGLNYEPTLAGDPFQLSTHPFPKAPFRILRASRGPEVANKGTCNPPPHLVRLISATNKLSRVKIFQSLVCSLVCSVLFAGTQFSSRVLSHSLRKANSSRVPAQDINLPSATNPVFRVLSKYTAKVDRFWITREEKARQAVRWVHGKAAVGDTCATLTFQTWRGSAFTWGHDMQLRWFRVRRHISRNE